MGMQHGFAIALVVSGLFAGLPASVAAGPLEDGAAAHRQGDYATALRIWQPLAEKGDAWAQAYLGDLYVGGRGVPKDFATAAAWYRKAAEQGLPVAQTKLASLFENGTGVAQDYAEAAKWYRKAADRGDAEAENSLGILYATGDGVALDNVQAYLWFSLAALGQSTSSMLAVKNRDIVAARMTPEQIAEADKLAQQWIANFGRQ